MSFLRNSYTLFTSDILKTTISLLIAIIIYKIIKFYIKVFSLPPGPIPVPLLGNGLYFRGSKEHWTSDLSKLVQKYGTVFTFWFGNKPKIIICDPDLGRECFNKNDFAGRPEFFLGQLLSTEDQSDVGFTDFGNKWEALRRVSHSAVQKYSTSDPLIGLVTDCVDQTIDAIIDREGLNQPFNSNNYIYHLFLNISAVSAFGKSYDIEDQEYKQIKYVLRDIFGDYSQNMFYWDFHPIFQTIDRKNVQKVKNIFKDAKQLIKNKFVNHYKDYLETEVRDFCDALISAKNDALKGGKESANYLIDNHLSMAVFDLFFAGTDATANVFDWILLLYLSYPGIQKIVKEEIESEIGDRIPTHEDRNRCHYVMAFISETMRFRNTSQLGTSHKTITKTKIGKFSVDKGQEVLLFQGHIMLSEKYWLNPDQFIPERFLDDGKYITTRPSAFIPFGVGRRVCLGEKLAIANLFLVFTRFIQKTSEYVVALNGNPSLDPNPMKSWNPMPKEFKITFKIKD